MREIHFDVFGTIIAIAPAHGAWDAFILGSNGTRRRADFAVPDFIAEEELSQYLGDLFHESATPANGDVRKV